MPTNQHQTSSTLFTTARRQLQAIASGDGPRARAAARGLRVLDGAPPTEAELRERLAENRRELDALKASGAQRPPAHDRAELARRMGMMTEFAPSAYTEAGGARLVLGSRPRLPSPLPTRPAAPSAPESSQPARAPAPQTLTPAPSALPAEDAKRLRDAMGIQPDGGPHVVATSTRLELHQ